MSTYSLMLTFKCVCAQYSMGMYSFFCVSLLRSSVSLLNVLLCIFTKIVYCVAQKLVRQTF